MFFGSSRFLCSVCPRLEIPRLSQKPELPAFDAVKKGERAFIETLSDRCA